MTATCAVLHRGHGPAPWACRYCSAPLTCGCLPAGTDGRPATADHVIPPVRGGAKHWSNIVPCCGPCNSAKGIAVYPDEWQPGVGLIEAAVGQRTYGTARWPSWRAMDVLNHVKASGDPRVSVTALHRDKPFAFGRDALQTAIGELSANGLVVARVVRDPFPRGTSIRRIGLFLAGEAA